MARFESRQITEYRLRCEATWDDDGSGCFGVGPRGFDENEARELAVEDGWRAILIMGARFEYDCWACPAHVRAHDTKESKS